MSKVVVRPAKHEDEREILALLRAMHEESRYAGIPFEEARAAHRLCASIGHEHCYVRVADDGAQLVGVMIGHLSDMDFSSEITAIERYIYVRQDHRGTWAALRLVDEFVEWAAGHGAIEVCAAVAAGVNDEKARDFYARLGFNLREPIYRLGRSPHVRA